MIGELAALGASVCWAVGSHLFGRIGRQGDVPAGSMNLGKCATAALAFAVTGLVLHGDLAPHLAPRAIGWLAASGFVGLALGDDAYFRAILSIGVRRALLLLSTAPVFVAIGGALWLHEALRPRDAAAILAVVVGVALVVQEQTAVRLSPLPRAPAPLSGIAFGLLAGVGQAAGSLMSRAGMAGGVSALDAARIRLPAGLAGIVLLAALSRRLVDFVQVLRRPNVLYAVAGSALVGTYCGLWLSQVAIGRASSAAVASTLLATSPIFALPLGRWLNAEPITARALGGTTIACAGLVVLTLGQR